MTPALLRPHLPESGWVPRSAEQRTDPARVPGGTDSGRSRGALLTEAPNGHEAPSPAAALPPRSPAPSSDLGECVIWPGPLNHKGYGRYLSTLAHRYVYEREIGPIPSGYHVDHICFQPACVNPAHLRLLTAEENSRLQRSSLKPRCVNGHEFAPENTYLRPAPRRGKREGRRDCRTCMRARSRNYKASLRATRMQLTVSPL